MRDVKDQLSEDPAATFDVEGFLAGIVPFRPVVKLHRRGDLLERLKELHDQINAHNKGEAVESSIDEDDADAIEAEYERVLSEWESDFQAFRFRAATAADWATATARCEADARRAKRDPKKASDEDVYVHMWALTSEDSPPVPAEAWRALLEHIGSVAARELLEGWLKINNGGADVAGGEAPFSPEHLPTRRNPEPSDD